MSSLNTFVLEPVKVADHIVLSKEAQKKLGASARTAVIIDAPKGKKTFEVEILVPNEPQCACLNPKKHRVNRTTLEHICTDKYGESRAGFHRKETRPERHTITRNGFWLMQKFEE